jgi:putative acetyltransferase
VTCEALRDLVVREERSDDFDAIAQVVEAAFTSPVEAKLVEDIRASPHYVPELSLVAEHEGRVVGHVMLSYSTLVDGDTERAILQLSPLAVAPDMQGRGIGSALVPAACALADARGEPLVVLEGSPAYYGRFGFEPSADYRIQLPIPDWAPPEASQLLPRRNFDSSLRGNVVYPAAFDAAGDH